MSNNPEKPDGQESSGAPLQNDVQQPAPSAPAAAPMPPAMQEFMRRALGIGSQSVGVQVAMGPPPNAFIEKLQPEHITSIIEQSGEDSRQEHWRSLIYFIGGVIGFLILCGLFLGFGKESLLMPIVSAFVGFAGGFGIGRASKK